jgi:hypothetical protein
MTIGMGSNVAGAYKEECPKELTLNLRIMRFLDSMGRKI